jgi:acyl-coenzyme A thioesterase PaaI-like protein
MNPPAGFELIPELIFKIGSPRPLFSTSSTKLKMFGHKKKKALWGEVRFDDNFTGPPGHAHGGAQAYLLDEAMGTVCWNSDVPVVAKSIEIHFVKPAPLHEDLVITAEVGRRSGKIVLVKACLSKDGQVLALGKGRFHILNYKRIAAMVGGKLPDSISRWFPQADRRRKA